MQMTDVEKMHMSQLTKKSASYVLLDNKRESFLVAFFKSLVDLTETSSTGRYAQQ